MTSKKPHITANALIRYCEAKAPERHRIIEDFRDNVFPPFKGWYGEVEGASRRYIGSGGDDDAALSDLEVRLERRPAASEFEDNRILKQLEALQALRETPLTKLKGAGRIELIRDDLLPFYIEGVRVSVRPTNLISRNKLGFRLPHVGVTKPYFSSSAPLSNESGALYGSLLHWFAEEQYDGQADPSLCFVVDVFRRRCFPAPKAFKQRRDLLAFSCREIAERWFAAAPVAVSTKKL